MLTLALYPVLVIVAVRLVLSLPTDEPLVEVAFHVVEVTAVHVAQSQDGAGGLDLLVGRDASALDVDHLRLGAPRVVLAVRDWGVVADELDVVGLRVRGRVPVDPTGPARSAGEDELRLGDVVVVRARARVGDDRGDGAAARVIGEKVGVDPVAAAAPSAPVDAARLASALLASSRTEAKSGNASAVTQIEEGITVVPSVTVIPFHDLALVDLRAVRRDHALDPTPARDRAGEVLLGDVDLVIKAAGIGLAT